MPAIVGRGVRSGRSSASADVIILLLGRAQGADADGSRVEVSPRRHLQNLAFLRQIGQRSPQAYVLRLQLVEPFRLVDLEPSWHSARKSQGVCSITPVFRLASATVVTSEIVTSVRQSLLITCSDVCFHIAIRAPFDGSGFPRTRGDRPIDVLSASVSSSVPPYARG